MKYQKGNVYLVNLNRYERRDISGKRPAIVIEIISEDKIRVIPISSSSYIGNKYSYPMHLIIRGERRKVWLLCDKEMIIDTSCVITQVGEVSTLQLENIICLLKEKGSKCREKNEDPKKEEALDDLITIPKGKEDLWEKYLLNINEKINKMSSPKEIWKERFIGFVFGIVASIVASLLMS